MKITERLQETVFQDFSLVGLKAAIILVALLYIFIALTVDNKWALAGTFAYAILP